MTFDLERLAARAQDERILRVLELIQGHYQDKLSTNEMAAQCGLSVRNLNRLFLQQLGLTPKQALTHQRI